MGWINRDIFLHNDAYNIHEIKKEEILLEEIERKEILSLQGKFAGELSEIDS